MFRQHWLGTQSGESYSLDFEYLLGEALNLHQKCLLKIRTFWHTLADNNPSMEVLPAVARALSEEQDRAKAVSKFLSSSLS